MTTSHRRQRILWTTLAGVLLFGFSSVRAEDWPQWRGTLRDGVWRETGIVESIPRDGLKIRWRAKIGRGYSGPVVAEGRVFVTDQVFDPEVERVVCFDEVTGEPRWTHAYPVDYADMEYGNGPRASPTVHEGRVYTLGTQGDLCCLDATTGKLFWQKDLQQEYQAEIPRYGASVAPLVEDDLLIVCIGGKPAASVIAFDRVTGAERWKSLEDEAAYSAPIVIDRGGVRQLIVWTADNIASLNPKTGDVYWTERWRTGFDAAQVVATPVLHEDRLLFVMAWNRGSKMFKLSSDKSAAELLWRTRSKPTTTMSTPMMIDGDYFYSMDNRGGLFCLDASSGDEVWSTGEVAGTGANSNAHLTPNGDRVFLFNQRGQIISAQLSPEGYRETGRTLLIEPTAAYRAQGPLTWSHPAYANKHVVARSDRALVSASLDAEDYPDLNQPLAANEIEFQELPEFSGANAVLAMSYSHDGQTLAVGTWIGSARLLDLANHKETQPAPTPFRNNCCGVVFSPDDTLLAYVGGSEFEQGGDTSRTAKVMLWDRETETLRGDLAGHKSKVTCAAFSPDGKTLATGSADKTIRLWDSATGKERAILEGHTDAVWALAFLPQSQTLVSACWDGTVKFWNTDRGEELASFRAHELEVLSIAISPDGKTLATGSGDATVRLWDTATRKLLATFAGHNGSVYSLSFSPDGETLASGSGDETVKLWDVANGKERLTLRGHQSGISAIAFSPDGHTLATAGREDAVRLWELDSATRIKASEK